MNLQNFRRKISIFGILGNVQFVILSTIAMFFYPGGYLFDHSTSGYIFWLNTISELGQTVTYSGEPNTVSMILFVCFFLVWAVAIIAFFAVFPSFFTKSRIAKWVSIIGSAFALISGGATFGVVLPMNLYGSIHFICSMIMYIAILLSQIFSAIAIFLSKRFPKKYGVFLLISALIIIIFIFIFIHFLAAPIMEIYVMGQKVITYAILTAIGATAYGARKLSAKTTA